MGPVIWVHRYLNRKADNYNTVGTEGHLYATDDAYSVLRCEIAECPPVNDEIPFADEAAPFDVLNRLAAAAFLWYLHFIHGDVDI